MRSGERGGGGLTKKGRLTINNTGRPFELRGGGDKLNTKSNWDRPVAHSAVLPEKWNKQLQYSWRFDPCELGIAGCSKPPPRAPRVERDGAEEEYLVTDDES